MLTLAPIVDALTRLPQFCLGRRQIALVLTALIVLWLDPIALLRLTPI